jgi:hypothetical protein
MRSMIDLVGVLHFVSLLSERTRPMSTRIRRTRRADRVTLPSMRLFVNRTNWIGACSRSTFVRTRDDRVSNVRDETMSSDPSTKHDRNDEDRDDVVSCRFSSAHRYAMIRHVECLSLSLLTFTRHGNGDTCRSLDATMARDKHRSTCNEQRHNQTSNGNSDVSRREHRIDERRTASAQSIDRYC